MTEAVDKLLEQDINNKLKQIQDSIVSHQNMMQILQNAKNELCNDKLLSIVNNLKWELSDYPSSNKEGNWEFISKIDENSIPYIYMDNSKNRRMYLDGLIVFYLYIEKNINPKIISLSTSSDIYKLIEITGIKLDLSEYFEDRKQDIANRQENLSEEIARYNEVMQNV